MTRRFVTFLFSLATFVFVMVPASGAQDLDQLARDVLFADESAERAATAALRAAGPRGMNHLLEVFDRSPGADPGRLDRTCGARDCAASRLFWYTDFDRALAAAQAQGKPILSLRLLGRLDEEFSCANSRFFRSVLYPNREISRYLRQSFILHWQSVRPVPVVHIDFGDGRTLDRTLTGNSIHYVLDPAGRLVDALPGLYAPGVFLRELRRAADDVGESRSLTDGEFDAWAQEHSRRTLEELDAGLRNDYARLREAAPNPWPILQLEPETADPTVVGGDLTVTKSMSEVSLFRAFNTPSDRTGPWRQLAVLYEEDARLDDSSRALVLSKARMLQARAAKLLIAAFERDIASDTMINQYRHRVEIHRRLASRQHPVDLESFNAEVYADLFEMSTDDPWLGLAPRFAYAALPAGGRVAAP